MINITKIRKGEVEGTFYFDVFFESEDWGGVIVPGWKLFEGRMEPPAKRVGNSWYKTALVPPKTAMAIQEALKRLNNEEVNAALSPTAWVTSKWGKTALEFVCSPPEAAAALHEMYREENMALSPSEIKDIRAKSWIEKHG